MFYRFSLYGHAAGTFCIFLNSRCWGRGAPNKAGKALITIVIWRNLWASAQRRSITFLQTHKSPSFVTTLSEHGRCWFSSKLRHVGAWFWLLCISMQAFVIGFRGKVSGPRHNCFWHPQVCQVGRTWLLLTKRAKCFSWSDWLLFVESDELQMSIVNIGKLNLYFDWQKHGWSLKGEET